MAHLITGHAGTEHIMPSDDGAFNAGVLGTGKYVLDLGNKFAHEIVSNNLVKISDGELVNQGRHMNIPMNNYEEVTIENGLQSVKRYDLICMRYTKNADTGIESAELVVVKGTSSTSPSDPVCEEGNILEGALIDDFPLYRVRLDGLNIEGVDCLFDTIPSIEVVNAKAEENAKDIAKIKGLFTPVLLKTITYDTLSTLEATVVNNVPWNDYVYLIISTGLFSNVNATLVIPTDYFASTGSGTRPIIGFQTTANNWYYSDLYKNDETSIFVKGYSVAENQRIRIYGYIKKIS